MPPWPRSPGAGKLGLAGGLPLQGRRPPHRTHGKPTVVGRQGLRGLWGPRHPLAVPLPVEATRGSDSGAWIWSVEGKGGAYLGDMARSQGDVSVPRLYVC